MNKWVIFDAMGVVFEVGDDTNDLLVPFIQNITPDATSELINEHYLEASLGKITSEEFWHKVGLGEVLKEKDIEREYLDNHLTLDKNFIEVATVLKKRYKLGMLSNDLKEWSQYLRKLHKLDELFDIVVISGEVGYRKADNKIYELFLERTNTRPEDCVFIDDRDKNLLAAIDIGMKVIKFQREQEESSFEVAKIQGFNQLEKVIENMMN